MIPTPQRVRANRLWSAAVALVAAGAVGVAARLAEPAPHVLAASLALAVLLAAALYRFGTRVLRRRRKVLARPFPPEWERVLAEHVAFYNRLSEAEKLRFRQLAAIFLDETPVLGVGCEVDDLARLLVAASAVIPIFGFPAWEYRSLDEVLIYPGDFDSSFGIGQPATDTLGMVGDTGGPFNRVMVLSRPDLLRGFQARQGKHNVGIHEFAHLIDKADGSIDGAPPFLPRELQRPWVELVRRELARAYRRRSDIPDYAFTSREEFFAVVSEYFFQSPQELARRHPQLYDILRHAFQQDTRDRFRGLAGSILQPSRRRTRAGAACPCGSGKRYKDCCLPDTRRVG